MGLDIEMKVSGTVDRNNIQSIRQSQRINGASQRGSIAIPQTVRGALGEVKPAPRPVQPPPPHTVHNSPYQQTQQHYQQAPQPRAPQPPVQPAQPPKKPAPPVIRYLPIFCSPIVNGLCQPPGGCFFILYHKTAKKGRDIDKNGKLPYNN